MNDNVMYKLLNLIDTKESIGELFKLGYSYSNIIVWYFELEERGYVYNESNDYKVLTLEGRKKLTELKNKKYIDRIGKLEQYRIQKKSVEDIYLP